MIISLDAADLDVIAPGVERIEAAMEAHLTAHNTAWNAIQESMKDLIDEVHKPEFDVAPALFERFDGLMRLNDKRNSSLARFTAATLRLGGLNAVAVVSDLDEAVSNEGTESVVNVVIDHLPIPDDSTAWEQLLEFRQDSRVRQYHTNLRAWMVRAAAGSMSPRELAGEIEASVANFDAYMREYHIGRALGTVESVIKAGAVGAVAGIGVNEVAAVAGAIGTIAVTLMRRRTELLREEMTAPGAELALISKARDQFNT